MRKIETKITLNNDGMHSAREYKKMVAMIRNNTFIKPKLYHLILMGSEQTKEYQSAVKALMLELRRNNIPAEWKACIEVDKYKRFHMHIFILAESKYFSPCTIINSNKPDSDKKIKGWLSTMMQKRSLTFHIAPPKDEMHQTAEGKIVNYAYVSVAKMDNCLEWISYLVKNRSKPKDIEHIYFGSRNRKFSSIIQTIL